MAHFFKSQEQELLSAPTLSWTPGDVSPAAWHIIWKELMQVNGTFVKEGIQYLLPTMT